MNLLTFVGCGVPVNLLTFEGCASEPDDLCGGVSDLMTCVFFCRYF